jgi:hypothetical protein
MKHFQNYWQALRSAVRSECWLPPTDVLGGDPMLTVQMGDAPEPGADTSNTAATPAVIGPKDLLPVTVPAAKGAK